MPTVKFRFPGGRYHATPWGHHVNEGLIEWPPCPWRLLRALLATGFSKLHWTDVPPAAQRLIEQLAGVLPCYRLPAASAAHSRHYMPILEGKTQKTTLVFDTWANVGQGELVVHWPCPLDTEQWELLAALTSSLSYLGRSESWVEAELTSDLPGTYSVVPCQEGQRRGPGWEQVLLLAAVSPHEYPAWRQRHAPAEAPSPAQRGRRTRRTGSRQESPYPPDLLSCLLKDTAWWKGHGWSQPPGSRYVLYWRPVDALEAGVPRAPRPVPARPVTTMLLAISSPSGNRSALPPVTRTLPQAELFHRAVVGRAANGRRVDCPELTGKDARGRPLCDRHAHAHTIPLDLDGDGHLDHILVYAAMGLGDAAQRAIRTLRRTWTKGGVGDLQLALVASGELEMLRRLPSPLDRQLASVLAPREGAMLWESLTPLVLPRFPKKKGKDTFAGQVQAELASRGLPAAERIEWNPHLTAQFRHFIRCRSRGHVAPKLDVGFGLRLWLTRPIQGPLLLGYAAHYGLGLFRACSETDVAEPATPPVDSHVLGGPRSVVAASPSTFR